MNKNKYLVISKSGQVLDPLEYSKSLECSHDFKIIIEREALGVKAEKNVEKPEYLKFANKLGFNWEPNSDIGFIQYNYKANLIMRILKEYSRSLVDSIGFPIYEVSGSNFFDMQYPVVESYASLFGDRLFKFESEDKKLVMSYDASYPQFNIAANSHMSEKDLPMAHFSISDCYRYEQSGECMLLFRGRKFNMPDLHPYLKSIDEAFEWYFEIEKQIEFAADAVKRKYYNVAKVSSIKNWEVYQEKIVEIAKRGEKEVLVEIKMDGADRYWIIDVDYSIVDSLGQVREIGCIQIDIGNAKRLGIVYMDKNNNYHNPVIIHSAVPGGLERYLYMAFDQFKNSFPIWLHPIQIRLIPVSEKFVPNCLDALAKFPNIRIDIDDRNEPVSKRIKQAHEDLVPNIFVFGEEEVKDPNKFAQLASKVINDYRDKPFVQFNWPKLVSKQVG